MNKHARIIRFVAVAAALGGAVTLGLALQSGKAPSTRAAAAPATVTEERHTAAAPARAAGPDPALLGRIAALEERVAASAPAAAEQAAPAEHKMPSPEEMKEMRRAAQEEFDAKVNQHFREPVSPEFQSTATASIKPRASALAERFQSSLVGVDCRSSSCVLTVEFPSFRAAMQSFPALVSADYGIPCGSSTMLDEPESPEVPYRVNVLMNGCEPRVGG